MEFQLSYFKSWKMMLWKCCTQYASKVGKLSSGHRTGKGQFSFQYQRKVMPKNAQTTTQLHSSHTLGRIGGRRRGDDRGWDGWMASPTRWTWVWVNSGSWWWTGKPGVLQFMGSQRGGHDWATELNWTELKEVKDLYLGNVVLRSQSGLFLSAPMRWSDP